MMGVGLSERVYKVSRGSEGERCNLSGLHA